MRVLLIAPLGIVAIAAAGAGACASFDEVSSNDAGVPGDASTNAGDAGDGSVASPSRRCDPTQPFGVPSKLEPPVNTAGDETYAALSEDELTIFFARGGGNDRDLYVAKRAAPNEPFGAPTQLQNLNSTFADDGLTLAPNLLSGVLSSSRATGGAAGDLFFTKRASVSDAYGTPVAINLVNGANDESDPYLLTEKKRLYFASDRSGEGKIYVSNVVGGESFEAPVEVAELGASGSYEGAPVPSKDDLEIFFASGRDGGTDRIFHAERPSPGSPFANITEVLQLGATGKRSIPSWLSPDRCVLYFSSDRDGDRDIYSATRVNVK